MIIIIILISFIIFFFLISFLLISFFLISLFYLNGNELDWGLNCCYFVKDDEDGLKPHPARMRFKVPKRVGRFVGPSGILAVVDTLI